MCAEGSYLEVRIFGHRWISDEFDTFSSNLTALEWALQVGYHLELEWLVMCCPQNSHKYLRGLRIRLFHLYYLRWCLLCFDEPTENEKNSIFKLCFKNSKNIMAPISYEYCQFKAQEIVQNSWSEFKIGYKGRHAGLTTYVAPEWYLRKMTEVYSKIDHIQEFWSLHSI